MPTLTSLFRSAVLALSCFALVSAPALAEVTPRQYATKVVPTPIRTDNEARAADADVTSAATLKPTLALGKAVERVEFANIIPGGNTQTGISIRINNLDRLKVVDDVLKASLLGSISIKSYLNEQLVDTWKMSSLVGVSVLVPDNQATLMLSPSTTSAFNRLELIAEGTANAYSVDFFEAFAPAASPAPLPVQLVSFQGKATAAGVQLSWQTASELNNQHFVVERANSSREFTVLGRLAGAGTSSQGRSYQFTDATPGALNYYRLRQVDTDGHACYSATVAVQALAAPTLAAYPCPATTTLTVASPAGAQLRIFNQQGALVQQATLTAGAQALDISRLPAGAYFLYEAGSGQRLRIEKAER